MKTNSIVLCEISIIMGIACALTFAVWLPGAVRSAEHESKMGGCT